MSATKIHCDYYEIYGPDWENVDDGKAEAIVKTIRNLELIGKKPDICGFVGTASTDMIIGGFFILQYEAELLHYDKRKKLDKRFDTPFERLFFVLFAKSGKLILQNRKFVDLPLSMPAATEKLRSTLTEVLQRSEVGYVLNFYSPDASIAPEVFRSEFKQSDRVSRISVENPDPEKIPSGFVYYNPQFERNSIIRESHQHDYPNFQKVDVEARPNGDLKTTHLVKDLVEVGKPTLMKYRLKGEDKILRKTQPKKFEIYVDVDMESLDVESLKMVITTLRVEIGLPVDIPARMPEGTQPPLLFPQVEESRDEDEEENEE